MGNTVSSATPRSASAGIDSYVSELSDVRYEKSLGSGHFMKTIRCKHREGLVVVKIFIKPDAGISLRKYVQELKAERDILLDIPNAFPYQRIIETDRAAYMIRQHLYSNLYDRISTRPFLASIEKKWIAYQILTGLAAAHAQHIYHGDIKTENILVTSWNWAYLTDFSSFKPTFLPEDNPADFSFFFDTSSRRVCYLAPERFYAPGETLFSDKDGSLCESMDIFSLGCTIAELFLEGTPLFSLSQLLRYRSGDYDPSPELERIDDLHIRNMIKHMIQLDPANRKTAETYLAEWAGKAFPEYFYTFLHNYVASLGDATVSANPLADRKIERIYHDFDKIAVALEIMNESTQDEVSELPERESPSGRAVLSGHVGDGCLIFTTIICSALRNVGQPSSKLFALDLLLALAVHLSDEPRLDRLVPYIVALLDDDCGYVRATAVTTLTQLLNMIERITPPDANIFPEYILPSLRRFSSDPDAFVRAKYAQCVPAIAETALRFLELSQLLRDNSHSELEADGDPYQQITYDSGLRDLQEIIQEEVITLLIDPDPLVKRTLLSEMARLCIIFGRQKANDVLLSHMITYLNDTDWQLRSAFFESIVGVGTFVGGRSLEEYILPLMVQALTDAEEFVIEKVLNALTSLAELGLLQKTKLKELAGTVVPLVCHPNTWIRFGAIAFISCAARLLPQIDVRCILYPIISPFLKTDIADITEVNLLESLKNPISRVLYDQTLAFASKAAAAGDRERVLSGGSYRGMEYNRPLHGVVDVASPTERGKVSQGPESNELLQRLRELGMTDEDKEKLFAMKYYISKATQSRLRKSAADMQYQWAYPDELEGKSDLVALKNFGITPHTLFLSPNEDFRPSFLVSDAVLPNAPWMSRAPSDSNVSQVFDPTRSLSPVSASVKQLRSPTHRRNASDTSLMQHLNVRARSPAMGEPYATSPTSLMSERLSETGTDATSTTVSSAPMPRSASANVLVPLSRTKHPSVGGGGLDSLLAVPGRASPMVSAPHNRKRRGHSRTGSDASSIVTSTTNDDAASVSDRVSLMTAGDGHPGLSTRSGMMGNSFEGKDKYIRRLVAKKVREYFPPPIPELGPKVSIRTAANAPAQRPRRAKGSSTLSHDWSGWRPEGILVAHLAEHREPINCLRISADNTFFVTCSDDKTVKVWDTARLEKNVTNRARLTYTGHEGKVKALTFCENTHSVASASEDGAIHVCRVECVNRGGAWRYIGYHPVRTMHLENDYVELLEHYDTETHSVLVYVTAKGKLCGIDLRTMTEVWSFDCPPQHGKVTAMVLDKQKIFLITGTHRGVFTLWDLRFKLQVKVWAHPSRKPIHRMGIWGGSEGLFITVAVDGPTQEVSVWNVDSSECQQVWCVVAAGPHGTDIEEEMNKVYGAGLKAVHPPDLDDFIGTKPSTTSDTTPISASANTSVFTFLTFPDAPYMLTAGTDRKVRLWSFTDIEASYVVTGLEPDDAPPRYSSHQFGDIQFHFEYTPTHHFTPTTSSVVSGSASTSASRSVSSPRLLRTASSSQQARTTNTGSGVGMVASPTLVRHRDAIVDAARTVLPFPMLITAGRDGVVKVWK
ncbi:VPS15 protein kinase [Spizellomyces punctatus DAOM BR117]|uniref:non-specific serine/threonine protein kinase n=1 Tax=Spizellomyces punctatus (strain DAOM BR117) TaxID=645134 RepID=A0A0L0H9V6_SPIPD|nr:VPS15 protein kinase [Spizellomyces punctatus DAOM BR117]KNC97679.1 VPS15 protein kinase [Spizellomyces punctatus DAOM BR117]|eukprot:XP_016605719.1 VPS15 protein kinase [Spizellomyces punctatus DAOM BR117]